MPRARRVGLLLPLLLPHCGECLAPHAAPCSCLRLPLPPSAPCCMPPPPCAGTAVVAAAGRPAGRCCGAAIPGQPSRCVVVACCCVCTLVVVSGSGLRALHAVAAAACSACSAARGGGGRASGRQHVVTLALAAAALLVRLPSRAHSTHGGLAFGAAADFQATAKQWTETYAHAVRVGLHPCAVARSVPPAGCWQHVAAVV